MGLSTEKSKIAIVATLLAVAVTYLNCDGYIPININTQSSVVDNDPNPDPVPMPPVKEEVPPPPPPEKKSLLYVASQTLGLIDVYEINATTGKLNKVSTVNTPGSVMPLAIHPNKKVLYAGITSKDSVASYNIDQTTGALTLQREVNVGLSAVYIHVDFAGKNLLVPSYSDSAVTVLPLAADGTLAANVGVKDTENTGPNSHAAITMADGKFAFVTNTVGNTISQFLFNAADGTLTPNSQPTVSGGSGNAGPRHVVVHPTLTNRLYAVNESNSSITSYALNDVTGRLSALQNISTLPAPVNGNSCADIHITPNGKFVYASNRGANNIAIFSVGDGGALFRVGNQPVSGIPREFEIDPSGKFLYVGGLTANKLGVFSINQTTGMLTPVEELNFNSPIWLFSLSL